ncbi:MAG TPA: YHS domain-containing (seleno)protein [Phycisphaerae bacterium]|nr:YHS domain-containing (seleno)protein [Phycisphaerae bacterium]
MKQRIVATGFLTALSAVFAVSAFADKPMSDMQPTSRAYLHSYNLPSTGIALEGYCPVAYFAVNKPVKGKAEFASTYDGVTYHFVSNDAKMLFEKEPQKYLPAYGGWCALGMAIEDKLPVDPTSFKIVNGRLMLFLKNPGIDALKVWNDGNEAELIAKADAHWKKVSK